MRSVVGSTVAVLLALATTLAAAEQDQLNADKMREIIKQWADTWVKSVLKLTPTETQIAAQILTELGAKPELDRSVLVALASSTDICADRVIDCHNLSYEKVKPIMAMSLEREKIAREEKKAIEDRADRDRTYTLALSSFGVSALSLVLSFIALAVKRSAYSENT
jgi:hypothetical protein